MTAQRESRGVAEFFHISWTLFLGLHAILAMPGWLHVPGEGDPVGVWLDLLGYLLFLGLFAASLAKPRSKAAAGLALGLWTALKIWHLPLVPNHIFLATLINLFLLLSLARGYGRHSPTPADCYRPLLPNLRGVVLLLYAFVVLHKLNSDFFDPQVSCAAAMYLEIADKLPILPTGPFFLALSIWVTLSIEALLPALLFFRATRRWGLALGYGFHSLLGLHPIAMVLSFTFEMFALYSVFWHPEAARGMAERLMGFSRAMERLLASRRALLIAGILFLGAAGVVGWSLLGGGGGRFPRLLPLFMEAHGWTVHGLAALVFLLAGAYAVAALRNRQALSMPRASMASWKEVSVVLLALVFLNGMTPYLGLKTVTNFSMFSNLMTAGPRTNHLFIGDGLMVFGYNGDLIEVLESDHPYFSWAQRNGMLVPRMAVYGIAKEAGSKPFRLVYKDAMGTEREGFFPGHLPELYEAEPNWFETKLLEFRTVPKEGPCPCQW